MKVMAFNARPDERAFFDHFGQSLNMDLELQPGTLTVDNAGLTRGFDGISCTCDLRIFVHQIVLYHLMVVE